MIQKKWLYSLRGMLSKWVRPKDWKLLEQFEHSLSEIIKGDPRSPPLKVKRSLATAGYGLIDIASESGGKQLSPLVQALVQFICGYHDMDYRDVAHIGHGRMIALHGSDDQRKLWLPELAQGSLIGIAATESAGGSRIQGAKTIAKFSGGKYHLHGEKVFVS